MHVVAMIAYGLTNWFAMLLFSALAGEHFLKVLVGGPFIVSGSIAALMLLDQLAYRLLREQAE